MPTSLEILLVEDNPTDALLVRETLADVKGTRYVVTGVVRLEAAELQLASTRPDVTLLDLGLPDSSGIVTFLRLRDRFPDVPVLVLTGLDDEAMALRAMQAGAQDYLLKEQLSPVLLHRSIRFAIERHRVTTALRDTEARFRQLADNIREVFWLTDAKLGEILYISPAYATIWGRDSSELYRDPSGWLAAIHPEDRERVREAARSRQAAGTYDEEYRILRPDGTIRWIRDQAYPVRDDAGTVIRIAGVAEDITSRQHLEAQLRQTQKMESIGLLAGGVAHDFNNWLTVISGCSELLADTLPAGSEEVELLTEIRHATERASALTRQLLAFSRREVVEPRVIDLNLVVIDAEKMLRRLLGEDVVLSTILAPDLRAVKVDPGQWGQILLNLAVNARDAMPRGGALTIETRNRILTEADARLSPGTEPGSYLELTVRDTGEGIPPDICSRIFEPFFTTKGLGRGTGLGLSVVHGIVVQSGGVIEVDTEIGRGTLFRILLPSVADAASAARSPGLPPSTHGTETILLVEDEESIRRISARGLTAHGYHVLTAGNGEEALHLLTQHPEAVHLVLTDVVMPRMAGRELAEALRARHPGIKVLYTSGYTDDAVMRHGIRQSEVAFIAKPYTPTALIQKIREVLDAPGRLAGPGTEPGAGERR